MIKIKSNKLAVITVAKVGSTNFFCCKYKNIKNILHSHDIRDIDNILKNESNYLIVVGIRNPIDRNLSLLFQTFNKPNTYVKTKINNYKGNSSRISNMTLNTHWSEVVKKYFNMDYHNVFNDWFNEFIDITKIDKFDKKKGYNFYKYQNNNIIFIYTLEKLDINENKICDILNITNFKNCNNSKHKPYRKLYDKVKQNIKYRKEYISNLLDTDIMRLFYTSEDIEKMRSKYKVVDNT